MAAAALLPGANPPTRPPPFPLAVSRGSWARARRGEAVPLPRRRLTSSAGSRRRSARCRLSLELAADGKALFVVNYESGTVTKLRTSDMSTLQTINACPQPIGITYDRVMNRVWVACYGGSIRVYNDR